MKTVHMWVREPEFYELEAASRRLGISRSSIMRVAWRELEASGLTHDRRKFVKKCVEPCRPRARQQLR